MTCNPHQDHATKRRNKQRIIPLEFMVPSVITCLCVVLVFSLAFLFDSATVECLAIVIV